MTESTASAGTFPAFRAALAAALPRSVAVIPFNLPPNVPKGVLFAATMYTARLAILGKDHVRQQMLHPQEIYHKMRATPTHLRINTKGCVLCAFMVTANQGGGAEVLKRASL